MHASLDMPPSTSALPPSRRSDDDTRPAGTRFVAPTPHGGLGLRVHGVEVRYAAHAALTLQRCDGLLCALQDWSALPLDWRWDAAVAPGMAAGTHVLVPWQWPTADALALSTRPLLGALELPWALLRALPAPPPLLAERLRWPALPALLVAARLHVAVDELRLLEPGGALVLPSSFARPWLGTLRAADEPSRGGDGVPVDLAVPARPRLAGRPPQGSTPAGEAHGNRLVCELRLAMASPLAADRLAPWHEGEALDAGPQATLWCDLGDGGPPMRLASGRLMPWGEGFAMWIESVCHPGAAAA